MDDENERTRRYGAGNAPVDPDFGQRGAFPGLDDLGPDDRMFYGPASDGMEYLKMVRSEALALPKSLTADRDLSTRLQEQHDRSAWYSDGACIAALDSESDSLEDNGSEADGIQDIYYQNLVKRFSRFRAEISTPPPPKMNTIKKVLPVAVNPQARKPQWNYELRRTSPTLSKLSSASQDDVIRGIERATSLITKPNMMAETECVNIASWIWTLLGLCRDVGTLSSEDVSVLRDLGKVALALASKLRLYHTQTIRYDMDEHPMADQDDSELSDWGIPDDADGNGHPVNNAIDEVTSEISEVKANMDSATEIEQARMTILERLENTSASNDLSVDETRPTEKSSTDSSRRALITLDIVVTVIGSSFGQKDLLEKRAVWN